jgi:hypothetical protein
MSLYTHHESYKEVVVKLSRSVPSYDTHKLLWALNGTDGYVVKEHDYPSHRLRCTVYHSGHRISTGWYSYVDCIGPGTEKQMLELIQPIMDIIRESSAGQSVPIYQPWQLELMRAPVSNPFSGAGFMVIRGGFGQLGPRFMPEIV